MYDSHSPKDTSLIRTELLGRRGVLIRGGLLYMYIWGIPSSDGIPYGLADFFFFFVCVVFFLLPPPKMAFLEAKHMEGNHGLT